MQVCKRHGLIFSPCFDGGGELHSKEEHELKKLNASRRTDRKGSMRQTLRNASDNIIQLSSPCSLLIVRASNEFLDKRKGNALSLRSHAPDISTAQ